MIPDHTIVLPTKVSGDKPQRIAIYNETGGHISARFAWHDRPHEYLLAVTLSVPREYRVVRVIWFWFCVAASMLFGAVAFGQEPAEYSRLHRLKATSRTLAGRIVWAQLKRDEIAERRAENRSRIASSFTPLSDEERAAKRLHLAWMYDQQGWYAAHEACLRGIRREWPNTPAAAEATLLLGGKQ